MKTLLVVAIVVLVVIIALVVAVPMIMKYPSSTPTTSPTNSSGLATGVTSTSTTTTAITQGASAPQFYILTPSEVASILGGTGWQVCESHSYNFTINDNGTVTIRFFNGTTIIEPVNSVPPTLGSFNVPSLKYGTSECLRGYINHNETTVNVGYFVFSTPAVATSFYNQLISGYGLPAPGEETMHVGTNTTVSYWSVSNVDYGSAILTHSGKALFLVTVITTYYIGVNHLEALLQDTMG